MEHALELSVRAAREESCHQGGCCPAIPQQDDFPQVSRLRLSSAALTSPSWLKDFSMAVVAAPQHTQGMRVVPESIVMGRAYRKRVGAEAARRRLFWFGPAQRERQRGGP